VKTVPHRKTKRNDLHEGKKKYKKELEGAGKGKKENSRIDHTVGPGSERKKKDDQKEERKRGKTQTARNTRKKRCRNKNTLEKRQNGDGKRLSLHKRKLKGKKESINNRNGGGARVRGIVEVEKKRANPMNEIIVWARGVAHLGKNNGEERGEKKGKTVGEEPNQAAEKQGREANHHGQIKERGNSNWGRKNLGKEGTCNREGGKEGR